MSDLVVTVHVKVADVCRAGEGFVDIDVSVSPRSNRPGADGYDEWRRRLNVRVSAPPLDGRANKEVCRYFSDLTGCRCEVSAGQTSRQKTVRIIGDPGAVMASLEAVDGRRREARGGSGRVGQAPPSGRRLSRPRGGQEGRQGAARGRRGRRVPVRAELRRPAEGGRGPLEGRQVRGDPDRLGPQGREPRGGP